MRPLGDRRARVRLEVVGVLWGTLDVASAARVVNISRQGALIESPQSVPLESVQSIRFTVGGESVTVDARVRHLRRAPSAETPEYLVGIEFLSTPDALLNSIERLATDIDPSL
jgi:PilZ domain